MRKIPVFLLLFFIFAKLSFSQNIKDADFSGSWYSSDKETLQEQINYFLDIANPPFIEDRPIAIVSPHAGISYSGKVAAYGFKAVTAKKIDTVIVVGFSHRKDYDGIAVFDQVGFKTPLGILYTDKDLAKKIADTDDKIYPLSLAFDQENSVELILPFIQAAFKNPKVLLLAIGRQSFENSRILGEALHEILKEKENFLIIASTDLSHYLTKNEAEKIDSATLDLILSLEPEKLYESCYGKNRMCGTAAVVSTIIAAEKLGANKSYLLRKSTSAESGGSRHKVVGYASVLFTKADMDNKKEKKMADILSKKQKDILLKIARDTITLYIKEGKIFNSQVDDPELKQVQGVFVTLHKTGTLRGCIGSIIGDKPLYAGIRDMAISSATKDPRFSKVTEDELDNIDIEISVLTPLQKISDPEEIVMGTHGVLVRQGFRSGVYLPQVATETNWTREQFMDSLCAHKAGIDKDAWRKGECDIFIFSAEVFGE